MRIKLENRLQNGGFKTWTDGRFLMCKHNANTDNFKSPVTGQSYRIFWDTYCHIDNWLIDYLMFYVPLKIPFHSYGDVIITSEGLQNLGLCSALRAFEQGGIMPHLLWHGPVVFRVLSERPPHLVVFYDTQGYAKNLFLPGSSAIAQVHWHCIYLMNKLQALWPTVCRWNWGPTQKD
jgi:hypothetical protein